MIKTHLHFQACKHMTVHMPVTLEIDMEKIALSLINLII